MVESGTTDNKTATKTAATTTVLIVGARGYVGNRILSAVLASDKKYEVKALIRPNSDASKIESLDSDNIQVVRGDMMDKQSLLDAIDSSETNVVINSANGYMQGHPEIDTVGGTYLVSLLSSLAVLCLWISHNSTTRTLPLLPRFFFLNSQQPSRCV